MGPATPFQRALGVPWGGHLRRRLFCSNLSRSGAANSTFFGAGLILSAPREVVSLVVTHQWCEKWASDATHSWKPSLPVYATSCMSIQPALQAVAIPSEESIDLLGLQGKTRPRMGSRRLR
jgi:hypothetical protein